MPVSGGFIKIQVNFCCRFKIEHESDYCAGQTSKDFQEGKQHC